MLNLSLPANEGNGSVVSEFYAAYRNYKDNKHFALERALLYYLERKREAQKTIRQNKLFKQVLEGALISSQKGRHIEISALKDVVKDVVDTLSRGERQTYLNQYEFLKQKREE